MQPLTSGSLPAPPYLSLVLTALVVMGSPGPSTISVTAVGAAFGARRSLPYLSGVVVGTLVVLLAVAVGLGSLLAAQPRLTPALMGVALVYIVYLAYRIATAPPLAAAAGGRTAPGWPSGLVLAAANPKAYAAIATVFTGNRLELPDPAVETLVKTAILAALIVLIHIGWLLAGTSMTAALRRPRLSRVINVTLAMALLVSTIPAVAQLLTSTRG
jgi:threonine/homoserine/homoserine lactone efflux protein